MADLLEKRLDILEKRADSSGTFISLLTATTN